MDVFKQNSETHLEIVQFSEKNSRVFAGFTTRNGGVSTDGFSSLNVGLHVHDKEEQVIANREKLAEEWGIPLENWLCLDQTHNDHVHIASIQDKGKGSVTYETAVKNTDAVITKEKNVLLFTCYADCVPLYFYDEKEEIIGLAHAGWKGTAKQIASKTIQRMEELGGNKDNIIVTIGPSICGECYAVSKEVEENLKRAMNGNTCGLSYKDNQTYADLKSVNKEILIQYGLKEENILITNYCTSCNEQLFFSYRRDKGNTGRHASFIIQR